MKAFKKLLALVLVLAMSVCIFTACGDDDKDSSSDKEDVTTQTEDTKKDGEDEEFDATVTTESDDKEAREYDKYSETKTSDSGGTAADKVAAYVVANRANYANSSSNEYGTGTLSSKGTSLVFGYKYKNKVPAETASTLKELLASEDMINQFSSNLAEIQAEEPAVTSLIVEYYNSDGSLLARKEYR